jgi:hypothetical protein
MADLDQLRAEADALRDELHAHDVQRDEIGARKIAKDAELFAAEHAASNPAPADVVIEAPIAVASAESPQEA